MTEQLKLSKQVCFPVYMLAKEIVNRYRPFLEELGVTYPQYLVLLVLWEQDGQTVSQIGEKTSSRQRNTDAVAEANGTEADHCPDTKQRRRTECKHYAYPTGKRFTGKALAVPKQLIEAMKVSLEELIQLKK